MSQNVAGIPDVALSSVYNSMHSYNVPKGTICIHLHVTYFKIISHDPIGHITRSGYSNVEYLFSTATNFTDFMDFGDFHEICSTKNYWKFYCDVDCRLKRRHQCRFVKIVSSTFLLVHLRNLQPSKKAPCGNYVDATTYIC